MLFIFGHSREKHQIPIMNCQNCKEKFDSSVRIPLIVCKRQHLCCQNCFDNYFTAEICKCPKCQEEIIKSQVARFRLYDKFEQKLRLNEEKHLKKMGQVKNLLLPTVREVINIKRVGKEKQYDQELRLRVKSLMKTGKYTIALTILKCLIENNPEESLAEDFIGLGTKEETWGFCQSQGYDWYCSNYGEQSLSLYDQIALCFLKENNYEEQKEWYSKMVEKYPQNYKVAYELAATEHNVHHIFQALVLYSKTIELNQSFGKSYEMIASIHLKEKKYEKAQHYAIEALSRSKRSMLSEYIQVVSREPINYSRIREELSNIKEAWPNYVRVINTIGDCFMKENLFEEARLSFCECYSLNKSFLQPHITLGKTLINLEQYEKATQILNEVLQKDITAEQRLDCWFGLGLATRELGQFKVAVRWFNNCISLNPSNLEAYVEVAYLYLVLEQYKTALATCKSYFEKAQDQTHHQRMYKIAVAASNELNDQQSVIDWLKKWVTTFPKDNEVFYSLASYNFLFNNLEEALIWYKECLDNNFLIWEVYPKMIEILRKISRPQEAQKLFEEFNRKCELNPEQFEIQKNQLLQKKLKKGKSKKECEKI